MNTTLLYSYEGWSCFLQSDSIKALRPQFLFQVEFFQPLLLWTEVGLLPAVNTKTDRILSC